MARRAKGKRGMSPAALKALVMLTMESKAARGLAAGIMRWAATHHEAEVRFFWRDSRPSGDVALGKWEPDGVVNWPFDRTLSSKMPSGVRAVVNVVHCDEIPEGMPAACGTVLCDDVEAGRMAAEHFARRNLRSFAFVGVASRFEWPARRGKAFAAALARRGRAAPAFFTIPPKFGEDGERALAEWLGALPKPCGLFAASDWCAAHVLDVCRAAGIEVPTSVQVLGVDDEEFVCENCVPPLSSIAPDFERGGYEAMKMLSGLARGRRGVARSRVYGMVGIVERASTRDSRGAARIVNAARDFIRLYAASGATAADAARAAGCSPRLLQMHFRKMLGRTVTEEIQRERLEKACSLLRHTDTPVEEIAPLCGYGDISFFRRLFRRAYGCTMREWRVRKPGPARRQPPPRTRDAVSPR